MDRTASPPSGQGPSILDIALEYHQRGWSIIPIVAGTKTPPKRFRWKQFQKRRPTEDELRSWFASRDDLGLAVILGIISGGLVCRDFDTMEGYVRWAAQHPDLARILPTVATARGRHVYCTADEQKITNVGDGELRGAGYCLLPPSRHPDGPQYTWVISLPDGELPRVDDIVAAGLLPKASTRQRSGRCREAQAMGGRGSCCKQQQKASHGVTSWPVDVELASMPLKDDVKKAIWETVPKTPRHQQQKGMRNGAVFEFCRALRGIPRFADASPQDLVESCLRPWHAVARKLGSIGSLSFDETRADFVYGWPRVRFPKGVEPMTAVFKKAKQCPLPQAALRYDSPGIRLLVSLCRELQRASHDCPFFLACRTVGKLIPVHHSTAAVWLNLLIHDRILEVVERNQRGTLRANRYRYLAD